MAARALVLAILLSCICTCNGLAARTPNPRNRRTSRSPSSAKKNGVASNKAPWSAWFAPKPPPKPKPTGLSAFLSREPRKPQPKPKRSLSEQFEDASQQLQDAVRDAPNTAQAALAEIRPLQVLSGFVFAVFIAGQSLIAGGNALSGYLSENGNGEVFERAVLFGTILGNVKESYVDRNVDIDKLFQTGVNSMLATLDPFSTYENAQQNDDLTVQTSGKYGGVGLTIGKDGDDVLVLGALEGFAYDAGVRAGDRIVAINDDTITGMSVDKVKDRLRGEPGTTIQLTVSRDGSPEPTLVIPVNRKLVKLPDVTLVTKKDDIGYMKLEGFSEGTAQETASAITQLQTKGPLKALIIDLRDNPGGLLDAAVAVSQQLVSQGTEIVSTAGRVYGEGTAISFRSNQPPLLRAETRLVLLVNSNTASAAEIVSGVVQDTDRGVIVGERTYGKGLVQVVEPLPGGAALKLTVAKYYTPSGRCIQAVSYAGGRLEASTNALLPATSESVASETAAPLSPTAPTEDSPSPPSRAPSKRRVPSLPPPAKSSPDSPGALRRIDPSEPSRPREASAQEQVMYLTQHGRSVKGGGGIGPDVIVEARQVGELERSLIQKGFFFDFASQWLQRHPASTEVLAQTIDKSSQAMYKEFITYVRERAKEEDMSLEPIGLQRQLASLQQSIGQSRVRSAKELEILRKLLQDEQFDEFRTEQTALRRDVREALLGRLTAPSQRLAEQLSTDVQVAKATAIADNEVEYNKLLLP